MRYQLSFFSSAENGIFNVKLVKYPFKSIYQANVCPRNLSKFYTICCMFLLFLICAGDIELNLGPRKNNTSYNFSFCHWNLNSIVAHNFSKLSLPKAYHIHYKFDMICLSESFLESSIPPNDERLYIKGYNLVRADNSSDSKKDDVGIYYNKLLAARLVEVKSLKECVIFHVSIKSEKRYVVSLYRWLSQTLRKQMCLIFF